MIVAGGVYRETCLAPSWSRIFGSGGRAAVVLSSLPGKVELHAYAAQSWIEDARTSFGTFGVGANLQAIDADIAFSYFHPLSRARLRPENIEMQPALTVEGDAVLRFGFVEGDVVVKGKRVVFDPQNPEEALRFRQNGSQAGALAIVLNEVELDESTGLSGQSAVDHLMATSGAQVVVVKRGPAGALVYAGRAPVAIPARMSDSIFKIGSGDVFSAVFAHYWAERSEGAEEAASAASAAVARYVASRDAQSAALGADEFPAAPIEGAPGPIYIAAPFFNLGQRWVIEEARTALLTLGATVFSPFHDIGVSGDCKQIAQGDLAGLRAARSVLAVIDGEDAGTLFEVGYARDRNIPVVALAENVRNESLTMLEGSDCRVAPDLTTAVYHAIWAAMR